ncbi:MAG: peptidoglycan-binding domain-containing protein [Xanthobacteraceae bacterium]
MRNAARKGRSADVDEDIAEHGPPRRFLANLGWSHRDAVGFAVGAFAAIMIVVNMLFLQPGPHPAPMVTSGIGSGPIAVRDMRVAGVSTLRPTERMRGVDTGAAPPPAARPATAVIADIQRELGRRGYYDGTVDGRYGPRTDAAIRDFEQAAGLKPTAEPGEALLRSVLRAPPKTRQAAVHTPTPPVRPADPIAEMLAPSRRVMAVQRALTEFGYGQIDPTGIVDADTQTAIEKFERQRKLPITGQMSDRVARELTAVTGRPLE